METLELSLERLLVGRTYGDIVDALANVAHYREGESDEKTAEDVLRKCAVELEQFIAPSKG